MKFHPTIPTSFNWKTSLLCARDIGITHKQHLSLISKAEWRFSSPEAKLPETDVTKILGMRFAQTVRNSQWDEALEILNEIQILVNDEKPPPAWQKGESPLS